MDTDIAALANLIALARKDKDDTTKAEISRTAFIDGLIAEGFTAVNVLPKAKLPAGFNGEHMRRKLETIGIAAIKIKGKRLNDAEIAKYFNDEIGKVVLLAGTAKGSLRNEAGVTQQTWNSELAAWVGKAIKSLAERAADNAAKAAGAPTPPKSKKEVFLDYLQKAYNLTFKEDCPCEDAEATQKDLLALAKSAVNGTLSTPKRA